MIGAHVARGIRSPGPVPVLLTALVAACGPGSPREGALPGMVLEERALLAVRESLPTISPENDGFGFARAVDLRFQDGRLVVLENQNGRLVVFDTAYRAVATIGREGAGPGELRGAMAMDVWAGGEYAVSEINNVRISLFDTAGRFLRSVSVPDGGAEFAYGPQGTLFVNAASDDHYFYAIGRDGTRRPLALRAAETYPAAAQGPRARGFSGELVAVTPDGAVHVFDRVFGGLIRFDSTGRRVAMAQLPEHLYDGLLEYTARVRADFGGTGDVYDVSVTDLTVTDDGRLLLLFPPVARVVGLLIDPDSYRAIPLAWTEGSEEAERRQGGARGVVREGRLYRVLGDHVTVYRLERP